MNEINPTYGSCSSIFQIGVAINATVMYLILGYNERLNSFVDFLYRDIELDKNEIEKVTQFPTRSNFLKFVVWSIEDEGRANCTKSLIDFIAVAIKIPIAKLSSWIGVVVSLYGLTMSGIQPSISISTVFVYTYIFLFIIIYPLMAYEAIYYLNLKDYFEKRHMEDGFIKKQGDNSHSFRALFLSNLMKGYYIWGHVIEGRQINIDSNNMYLRILKIIFIPITLISKNSRILNHILYDIIYSVKFIFLRKDVYQEIVNKMSDDELMSSFSAADKVESDVFDAIVSLRRGPPCWSGSFRPVF